MTRSMFISLFVVFITTCSCAQEQDVVKVELTRCQVDCPSSYCPTREQQNVELDNKDFCENHCKCGFNFRRAANGTCIATQKCPPFKCFGPNEVYDACPSYCPTDCSHATPDGDCSSFGNIFINIVVECVPACRCAKGYWRKDGICVSYHQCLRQ